MSMYLCAGKMGMHLLQPEISFVPKRNIMTYELSGLYFQQNEISSQFYITVQSPVLRSLSLHVDVLRYGLTRIKYLKNNQIQSSVLFVFLYQRNGYSYWFEVQSLRLRNHIILVTYLLG